MNGEATVSKPSRLNDKAYKQAHRDIEEETKSTKFRYEFDIRYYYCTVCTVFASRAHAMLECLGRRPMIIFLSSSAHSFSNEPNMSRTTWHRPEGWPTIHSQMDEFIYKHTFLISIAQASSDEPQAQCSLSHWHHHAPGPSLVIATALALDDLRHVSVFRELGPFPIPPSRSSSGDWETLLSSVTVTAHLDAGQDVDIRCKSIVQHIVAQLQNAAPVEGPSSSSLSQECKSLNLYTIETLTRGENGLEDVVDADEMVWKWAKPASPYRTTGFWHTTVEEAVTDGVWNAGRGFLLLAEKVGKCQKKAMFEGGRE